MARQVAKLFYRIFLSNRLTSFYDRFHQNDPLGKRGEREAERFLLRQGWIIVERGYQDKLGEIDLIAIDDRTIVFVEVKTRSSDVAGDPTEAIDATKRRHLTQTAQGYLKWHRLTECRARFDVIAISWPEAQPPKIVHYRNAFEPVGNFQMF